MRAFMLDKMRLNHRPTLDRHVYNTQINSDRLRDPIDPVSRLQKFW